jgi:hypothetical protein
MKVCSRGSFPKQNYQSRHLRELSDVLLGNSRIKRAAAATRVFRALPELRVAKRISVGCTSRCKGRRRANSYIEQNPIWENEDDYRAQVPAERMDVLAAAILDNKRRRSVDSGHGADIVNRSLLTHTNALLREFAAKRHEVQTPGSVAKGQSSDLLQL